MNGNEILADTNAIIYFVNGNSCMKPYENATVSVSIISEMELLSFPKITDQETDEDKSGDTGKASYPGTYSRSET